MTNSFPHIDTNSTLKDIQKEEPKYKFAISTVGIKNFKLPIFIVTKDDGIQHTVANIHGYVDLDADKKGINMSRIPIGLQKFINKRLDMELISDIAKHIRLKSEAQSCQLIYEFPYFIQKTAPVSKETGLVNYNVVFDVFHNCEKTTHKMSVTITGMSLCPCSKEISEGQGAHCQRSKIRIECIPCNNDEFIWIEDIIRIGEESCACPIFSVLKRFDEKFVTQFSYNNPYFVEDIARSCYYKLNHKENIEWFAIEVINEESIHQHDAYCKIEKDGVTYG